ncbi:hypothetical protein WME89_19820 [Sorangium sp. So ce321]|uniref:hypothetical protein n=1 Tax=Sorangium sp. So ce321 TaxID=3133300 RepID=UPI003F63415A
MRTVPCRASAHVTNEMSSIQISKANRAPKRNRIPDTCLLDATKQILATQMLGDARFDIGLDVVPANKIDASYYFLDSIRAIAQ